MHRQNRYSRLSMWRPALLILAAMLLVSGALAGPSVTGLAAQPATPEAAATPGPAPELVAATNYLLRQQDESGGFVGYSGEPDPGMTTDAVYALKAAGQRGALTESAIAQAIIYLEEAGPDYAASGAGQAAKVAMAAIAGGRDPRSFGGVDLIATMTTPPAATPEAAPATGAGIYGDNLYGHVLVLLALAAANEPVPDAAIDVLRVTQIEDGSWGYAGSTELGSGDSNTTALVIQALVATGHGTDPMIESALAYLQSVETMLGQFLFEADEAIMADANSTALAVQALIAAGQDPSSPEWTNATRGLVAFQNVSGGFRYVDAEPADNLLATVQAIPALAGYTLPVATACPVPAPEAAIDGTPVIELPAPGRGQAPCVPAA